MSNHGATGTVAKQSKADHYQEHYRSRMIAGFATKYIFTWHRRMLDFARRKIAGMSTADVLEVGAGWGFFAEACRQRHIAYSGLEMNACQAESLREQGYDVTASAIPPFPPGPPVDVIWMSHVLEHAANYTEARDMLTAIRSRLEPGGHLVVICPDLKSWKFEFWGVDWSHGFPTTLRRLRQIFDETGFKVVDARYHVASCTQPVLVWLLTRLFSLIPVAFLDFFFEKFLGRSFCYSFMGVFGWRQLLVIGQKPHEPNDPSAGPGPECCGALADRHPSLDA